MADPFATPLDPSAPQDTESAAEGAERIRQLKLALIERFSTAFGGFPEEFPARAGEAQLFPIASVLVGTDAQRPALPYREGTVWVSTDTKEFWYGNRDGEWEVLGASAGGAFGPTVQAVTYIGENIEGTRVSELSPTANRVIAVKVISTVEPGGRITIAGDEFDPPLILDRSTTIAVANMMIPLTGSVGEVYCVPIIPSDPGDTEVSELHLILYDSSGSAISSGTEVVVNLMIVTSTFIEPDEYADEYA